MPPYHKGVGLCTQRQKNSTPAGANSRAVPALLQGAWALHIVREVLTCVEWALQAQPILLCGAQVSTDNTKGLRGRSGAPGTLGPWYADSWLAVSPLRGPEGGAGPCLASSTLLLMPWA